MRKKVNFDIKLPVIKSEAPKPKNVSMDDYLRFVEFNLMHTVDLETCKKQKRIAMANVQFKL